MSEHKVHDIFINGAFTPSHSSDTLPYHNPANGQVIGTIASCDAEDVDQAVSAARVALDGWSTKSGAERAVYLNKICQLLRDHKPRFAALETMNMGKPRREADWDLDDVAHCFEYFAEQAIALDKRQYTPVALPDPNFKLELRYEATGVVGAIIPWNYPMLMLAWKVAPALAAGCTMVLKPSEYTPATALEFAKLTVEAGLPAGVLNVLTGAGATGALVSDHKGIDKLAFTGSVPTGVKVAMAAARDMKNLTLELGGKSPLIIFDDVDIPQAVEWVMFGVFWTNGQVCSSTSRLLLHESIAPKFLEKLVHEAKRVQIGDPNKPEYADRTGMIGPLVSAPQLKRVQDFIKGAIDQGAKVLAGGSSPVGDEFKGGYFIEPTILSVTTDMTIWREEVFGPVLSVVTFKTEEEAVKLANDSFYGLGAGVISKDDARNARVVRALRVGLVWVNCSQPCFCEGPWGGTKRSGNGTRELGPNGIDNYLEVKAITTYLKPEKQFGWYPIEQ